MPQSLHGALAETAEREGTSLNQLITGTLAGAIGWSDEDGNAPAGAATRTQASPAPRRRLLVLLAVNAVVVGLAAASAVALLLVAWLG
jgi:HicB family